MIAYTPVHDTVRQTPPQRGGQTTLQDSQEDKQCNNAAEGTGDTALRPGLHAAEDCRYARPVR